MTHHCQLHLKLLIKKSSIQNIINNEFANISDWLKLNKLSLNIKKTKYMIFHTPMKRVPSFVLKIEDIKVCNFNFLGLTIDGKVTLAFPIRFLKILAL